ncbi:hypothetical protein SAPIO_CDS6954 [Scedosporium apiospermum]|uniref:Heterokaryon incompatibility domain-containing protein n=1 Tax=Pseudallescheria apiosperma TaxID=563466 RepID=A0A084G2S8_PSEDA|nr:uncharacterized protein SAPIO_CDS6954 [Scedosporium apiospermum]KEZ41640.1 hypothetical protein SAPIO_CDS6954 [Scedosporium apiospermum]
MSIQPPPRFSLGDRWIDFWASDEMWMRQLANVETMALHHADAHGLRVFVYAVLRGHTAVARWLIRNRTPYTSDMNFFAQHGITPEMLAPLPERQFLSSAYLPQQPCPACRRFDFPARLARRQTELAGGVGHSPASETAAGDPANNNNTLVIDEATWGTDLVAAFDNVGEVGSGDGSNDPTLVDTPVKLLVTAGRRSRYLALSHCWGAARDHQTLRNNLAARQEQGFELNGADRLPATIADAVHLTRLLGFRYLWVDSLCIVQDDHDDWQREAARMCDVYRLAYLTITASRAADDAEGFSGIRTGFAGVAVRVRAPSASVPVSTSASAYEAVIHLRPDHPKVESYRDYHSAPLDARGWTLQEACLSRAQLRFYSLETVWTCRTCEWNESDPSVANVYAIDRRTQWSPIKLPALTAPWVAKDLTYPGHWYDLVREYTGRQLTHESDRLPALAGIARIVAEAGGWGEGGGEERGALGTDRGKDPSSQLYLAGLWRSDLAYGLCWHCKTLETPPPANLPSWSWIAVSAGTAVTHPIAPDHQWPLGGLDTAADAVSITLQGPDPFGAICAGAHIRVTGVLLRPLRLCSSNPNMTYIVSFAFPRGRSAAGIRHDDNDVGLLRSSLVWDIPYKEANRGLEALCLWHDGDKATASSPVNIHGILVRRRRVDRPRTCVFSQLFQCHRRRELKGASVGSTGSGAVVSESVESAHVVYERVGAFECFDTLDSISSFGQSSVVLV